MPSKITEQFEMIWKKLLLEIYFPSEIFVTYLEKHT